MSSIALVRNTRRACLTLLLWLAGSSSALLARDPTPPRASATDFDFLEGAWDITYNNRGLDVPADVRGTWTGTRQADGRVLYDEFRLFGPDGDTVVLGLTYRIFDHTKGRWDMRYVSVITPGSDGRTPQLTANWAEVTGWRDGSTMRLEQQGGAWRLRITYYDIGADRFSWKADVSTDGGKTWNPEQIRIEARRPPGALPGRSSCDP